MSSHKVKQNLARKGWPRVRVWNGGSCDRIYVSSDNGEECGYIQFPKYGGIDYEPLRKHKNEIRRAVEGR